MFVKACDLLAAKFENRKNNVKLNAFYKINAKCKALFDIQGEELAMSR